MFSLLGNVVVVLFIDDYLSIKLTCQIDSCQSIRYTYWMTMPTQITDPFRPVAAGCDVPSQGAFNDNELTDLMQKLKALADPTRLRLVQLIAACSDCTACICDLTVPLGVTQPTVSHHMRLLVEAGLVARQQRGKWAHYSLQLNAFTSLRQQLIQLFPPGATA